MPGTEQNVQENGQPREVATEIDTARLPAADQVVVGDRVDVEVRDLGPLGIADDVTVARPVAEVLDLVEAVAPLDGVDQLLERELALTAHDEVGVLAALPRA